MAPTNLLLPIQLLTGCLLTKADPEQNFLPGSSQSQLMPVLKRILNRLRMAQPDRKTRTNKQP